MMQTRKQKERINVAYVLAGIAPAGVSIFVDVAEAEAIFDAAREANSNFAGMSDQAIVDYCSNLGEHELQGMISLVNGRYFENIVAEQTGGTLFEAKNHPDTDMTLNGTEISIKSNDATADSITEYETLSPQDLGMDDAELRERTAEVMDGDIIDATDALIAGTVGVGTMAMLQAAGKTIEEWEALSEKEKTNVRAAWYGAKATGRTTVETAKSTWSLLKMAGKGLKKIHEAYEENVKQERVRSSAFNDWKITEDPHYQGYKIATLDKNGTKRTIRITPSGEILDKVNPRDAIKQASGKLAANLNK